MCCVGEFNLSQTSLTSADALTALRELPNTNPTFYHEITGGKGNEGTNTEEDFIEGEDDVVEDGTDIPVDVIIAQIISGDSMPEEGFAVNNEGVVVRTGVAEETEVVHDELANGEAMPAVSLGRGHRTKVPSNKYNAAWEEH
jgi:hypothetical protein